MTLLAPLLLAGLVGLALPLIAHLRGREEPRTIVFAARRFLEGGDEILSQRRTLRERLLLALRLLLLALVALALARPVSRHEADLAVLGEAHDAVLLIDGSRSMGLRIDDQSLFAATGEAAAALAAALPAGSRIGLVGSDPALPRIELGADPQAPVAALRERLAAGDPRPGSWRLGDRLPAALALLADEGRPRVVYAIGDRSAGGLASLPTSVGEVAVIPVAVDGPIEGPVAAPPEHLGIAAATWEAAPEIDRGALRITAEIRSDAPADPDRRHQASVALRIAGELVTQASVEVAAGQSASVELTHTMAGDQGPAPATLELIQPDDPLPSDDRRHLWLAADDRLSVALVNGDPSEVRTHDEVFFLATALASEGGDRRLLVRNLAPDQLERQLREGGEGALAGIDVLVLANVPAPPEDVSRAIVARVREGMGLWVTVGERVEAAAYNDRLGALLPSSSASRSSPAPRPGGARRRARGWRPPTSITRRCGG
ncbi:MAG: BatA domain-containing protein [Myxococcales bacterium]|nr:BatA domain-containing protein [Myxococcales bacterium]